ncbi:hypothetical protein [Natrinema sp. SYSU A 869]|uniref:hypothetical protein n=1 Tax=Natrinema sp. SYSU A 869 TaxID=2871694 RepID=UPI001CA3DC8A|nr:hypothetical protein [Natrinema sp. SYSU A 869]
MSFPVRRANVVSGSIVALLTAPTGIGAAVGGWIAARQTGRPRTGAIAGGMTGVLVAIPWAVVVYAASAGLIGRIGYHNEWLQIGLTPVAPETFVLWQEIGIAVLVALGIVTAAIFGGLLAGHSTNGPGDVRRKPIQSK